jgi:hypothetical protein
MKCRCPDCGAVYSGNGGGHCRTCHRTFTSVSAADKHRVGPYEPKGVRRCADLLDDWRPDRDGQLRQVPWRLTARGWTHHPERELQRRHQDGAA